MNAPEIRLMETRDVPKVHEIEKMCFSIPWSPRAFEDEVTKNACARYLVLTVNGVPCAYGGMWFVVDEAHVTNIAVHPDYRGRGFGEQLTRSLIQLAADSGMIWMTLECRRSNAVAQNLYRKLGFKEVGFRKRYYADNNEDALVMALEELPPGEPLNDPKLIFE